MRKRPFTLLELMAALTVFLICLEIIASVIINTHKSEAYNDSRFRITLVMDNILQEVRPEYTDADLERILQDEEKRNQFAKYKISWEMKRTVNGIQLTFFHRKRKTFSTQL